MRKEIGEHEIDKHWNLVRIRELNEKKYHFYMVLQEKEVPIWESHKTQSMYVRPWRYAEMGENYWDIYYPVVNWMSVRSIITLSILRELQTKSVYFVLAYTQDDVKIDIFMALPIFFGIEGDHPR